MGLFNGKEVNELVVKTKENTNDIMAVRRDIESNRYEIENFKVQQEEKMQLLMDEILNIKNNYSNKVRLIEDEKDSLKNELDEIMSLQKIKKDKLTILDVCKYPDVINIKTAEFKYYLYKNGVMNMTINKERNSFTLNIDGLDKVNSELKEHFLIVENKLLFNNTILEYIKKYEKEILESVNQYNAKQGQYKTSKKKLESRNVGNYQDEINKICSPDGIYENNKDKWKAIYKIFMIKYPSIFNEWNNFKETTESDKTHKSSLVHYVVTEKGEGNYLLKIACDLFA